MVVGGGVWRISDGVLSFRVAVGSCFARLCLADGGSVPATKVFFTEASLGRDGFKFINHAYKEGLLNDSTFAQEGA